MIEYIISSEQLERLIEGIEHDTGREINNVVCDGAELSKIVRCRDCIYLDTDGYCTWLEFIHGDISDKFCAWGERR